VVAKAAQGGHISVFVLIEPTRVATRFPDDQSAVDIELTRTAQTVNQWHFSHSEKCVPGGTGYSDRIDSVATR
jgi:hypothetical protein